LTLLSCEKERKEKKEIFSLLFSSKQKLREGEEDFNAQNSSNNEKSNLAIDFTIQDSLSNLAIDFTIQDSFCLFS